MLEDVDAGVTVFPTLPAGIEDRERLNENEARMLELESIIRELRAGKDQAT